MNSRKTWTPTLLRSLRRFQRGERVTSGAEIDCRPVGHLHGGMRAAQRDEVVAHEFAAVIPVIQRDVFESPQREPSPRKASVSDRRCRIMSRPRRVRRLRSVRSEPMIRGKPVSGRTGLVSQWLSLELATKSRRKRIR